MTKYKARVYGYHLDLYGHVNNARYLEFLEAARWDFIEAHMPLSELNRLGIAFLVVNIDINYRRPVGLGQLLEIQTSMGHISTKSARVNQKIILSDRNEQVADATVTFVILDNRTKKVQPITGELKDMLNKFKM